MYCSKCGTPFDASSKFCAVCGAQLASPAGNFTQTQPVQVDQGGDDELYRAVIGPKNQDAYLEYFREADRLSKTPASWHWPAFFITFNWMLYRKMWGASAIYFLLPYLVLIPIGIAGAVIGKNSEEFMGLSYLAFFAILFVLPPMYAKALYYRHCKKKIAEARKSSVEIQRQIGELTGRGGTSNAVFILVLIFGSISVIGILAAVALPAYQDYTVRAKIAEATVIAKNASNSVESYYFQTKQIPSTIEETGFITPRNASISGVSVDSQNGVVTVLMATSPIQGKSLLMVPSQTADGTITWKCQSSDIPQKFLPQACRQ